MLPAVLGMFALDPVIDFTDTGIDVATLLQNQVILRQNSATQAMISFDMLITIFQMIDSKIEDIEDDYEINKIQMALYNPKVLNKLLGDALNFGNDISSVVDLNDSLYDWDVPSWLQWAEDIWFRAFPSIPQDYYDFQKMWKFRDDSNSTDLFLTEEQKYCNSKWPRFY